MVCAMLCCDEALERKVFSRCHQFVNTWAMTCLTACLGCWSFLPLSLSEEKEKKGEPSQYQITSNTTSGLVGRHLIGPNGDDDVDDDDDDTITRRLGISFTFRFTTSHYRQCPRSNVKGTANRRALHPPDNRRLLPRRWRVIIITKPLDLHLQAARH